MPGRSWLRDRVSHRINGTIQRVIRDDGHQPAAADWDTLVVLDACRFDLFAHAASELLPDLQRRGPVLSPASATNDWLNAAFPGEYPDIVYTAGNPMVSRVAPDRWHELKPVWESAFDQSIGTVPAGPVTDAALESHEDHPHKRHIVHYLQPHAPLRDGNGGWTGWQSFRDFEPDSGGYKNIWLAASDGAVSLDTLRSLYRETLLYALKEVRQLLDEIGGRVAITSDHGNYIGERGWPVPIKQFGHPPGHSQTAVRRVPWTVRPGERRRIDTAEVTESDAMPQAAQLEALGYR